MKTPGFSVVAILTLTLGIGANTAIFTLINATMLRKLPVQQPDRLVLFSDDPSEGVVTGDPPTRWNHFSNESYEHFRKDNQVFEDLAAFQLGRFGILLRAGDNHPRSAVGRLVSGNYFSVLGVRAGLGRTILPEDDRAGAPPVAVISHRAWEREFGRAMDVIGRPVTVNGLSCEIVGVMPAEFFGESVQRPPDFWLPIQLQPQATRRASYLESKDTHWLNLIGRLRAGVTQEQAQAAMKVAARQFMENWAGANPSEERKGRIERTRVPLASGARGISILRERYSEPLQALMAIVLLVLVISCANVSTLLLSRAAVREKEMATRMALGATRGALLRQLCLEGLVMAGVAAMLGLIAAHWGVRLMVTMFANREVPLHLTPDVTVLGFTTGVSLFTGVLLALVPALRISGLDLVTALKSSGFIPSGTRMRLGLGKGLVVVQVAVSFLLLVASGLLIRSLLKLEGQELGFHPEKVLQVRMDARRSGYTAEQLPALYRSLQERVRALSGVRGVTVMSYSPLSGSLNSSNVSVEGQAPHHEQNMSAERADVVPDYFETLGIPVVAGRGIAEGDTRSTARVAVVNQTFARRFLPNADPLGKRFDFGSPFDGGAAYLIVGVAGDVRTQGLREEVFPTAWVAALQTPVEATPFLNELVVRVEGDPAAAARDVREAIREAAPQLVVLLAQPMEVQVQNFTRRERSFAKLASAFGILAAVLCCVGLYGLMAFAVTRRTREIGIRMALGEKPVDVLQRVLRESFWLLFAGLAFGIPASYGAARLLANQLFGVSGFDPVALLASIALLFVTVALAAFLPARRAMRVDPMVALRYE